MSHTNQHMPWYIPLIITPETTVVLILPSVCCCTRQSRNLWPVNSCMLQLMHMLMLLLHICFYLLNVILISEFLFSILDYFCFVTNTSVFFFQPCCMSLHCLLWIYIWISVLILNNIFIHFEVSLPYVYIYIWNSPIGHKEMYVCFQKSSSEQQYMISILYIVLFYSSHYFNS